MFPQALDSVLRVSFDRWKKKGSAHPIETESEVLQRRIWTQLRNGDPPFVNLFVKTQNDIPLRLNAVYIMETKAIKFYHLLLFDDASDVVNEEDHEARPT